MAAAIRKQLTPTMQAAVDMAREHGGALHRHPGGFWAGPEWKLHGAPYVGTPTVEALVRRGVARHSEWKDGRMGRFPVKMELIDGRTRAD